LAREAGFKFPLAITAAVWARINAIPESLQCVQDVQGRLWDVIWMASLEARRARRASHDTDRVTFKVILVGQSPDGDYEDTDKNIVEFQLAIGSGDQGEPVMTIMELDED
jgi:hypothetical protein